MSAASSAASGRRTRPRKAAGIAGARVLEDVKLSIAGSLVRFAETHPSDDAEVAAQLVEVIGLIHGEATSAAA